MLRVLLVDDETIVRRGLMRLIPWSEYDMKVTGEAPDGLKALEMLRKDVFDIVFLDLSMPVMDGFELLEHINQEYPSLVKVVLTCHADVKMIQRSILSDIAGYLLKTDFEESDIRQTLRRVQEKAQLSQQMKTCALLVTDGEEIQIPEHMVLRRAGKGQKILRAGNEAVMEALQGKVGGRLLLLEDTDAQKMLKYPSFLQETVECFLYYQGKVQGNVSRLQPYTVEREKWPQLLEEMHDGAWMVTGEAPLLMAKLENARVPGKDVVERLKMLSEELSFIPDLLPQEENRITLSDFSHACAVMQQLQSSVQERMRKERISEDVALGCVRALVLLRESEFLFEKTEDLAARVGFSRSHFSRSFTRFTHMTFRTYVRLRREACIRHLLFSEHLTLSEVAMRLGCVNEEYFCKNYQKLLTEEDHHASQK